MLVSVPECLSIMGVRSHPFTAELSLGSRSSKDQAGKTSEYRKGGFMKVAISRFFILAVMVAIVVIAGITPVLAQTPNFQPGQGFNQNQLCPSSGCLITVHGGTIDNLAGWTPNV